jgi:serine/threonine-protein kinase
MPLAAASRPDIPAAVDDIIQKACAKNRDHRFQRCDELVAAVDRILYPPPPPTLREAPPATTAIPLVVAAPRDGRPEGAAPDGVSPTLSTTPGRTANHLPPTVEEELPQLPISRRSVWPWLVVVGVLVAGGAGAVLAMGLVPGVPGLFKPGHHGHADAGAPAASVSASADAGPERKALEALAGAWVGNGRELSAVLSGSDLEFRVKKPDQFPRQGYEAGEARFVLRATADPNVFTVEDRIRPVPPTGKTYDARARGTCQEVWTTAGADPLHAHWDGTRLTVEFAKIEPAPANFTTEGAKVTSCIGLRDLRASKVVSVLTRP